MDIEALDKLYLEISQFTKATTARELMAIAALESVAKWFQDYANGHTAKGDADKAKRNQERADFATSVIESLKVRRP